GEMRNHLALRRLLIRDKRLVEVNDLVQAAQQQLVEGDTADRVISLLWGQRRGRGRGAEEGDSLELVGGDGVAVPAAARCGNVGIKEMRWQARVERAAALR